MKSLTHLIIHIYFFAFLSYCFQVQFRLFNPLATKGKTNVNA